MDKMRLKQVQEFGDLSNTSNEDYLSFNSQGEIITTAGPLTAQTGIPGDGVRIKFDGQFSATNFEGDGDTFQGDDYFALWGKWNTSTYGDVDPEQQAQDGGQLDTIAWSAGGTNLGFIDHIQIPDNSPLKTKIDELYAVLSGQPQFSTSSWCNIHFSKTNDLGGPDWFFSELRSSVIDGGTVHYFRINWPSDDLNAPSGQEFTQFQDGVQYDVRLSAGLIDGPTGAQGSVGYVGPQGPAGVVGNCSEFTILSAQDGAVPLQNGDITFINSSTGQYINSYNMVSGDIVRVAINHAGGNFMSWVAPYGARFSIERADGVGGLQQFNCSSVSYVDGGVNIDYYQLNVSSIIEYGIPSTAEATGLCVKMVYAFSQPGGGGGFGGGFGGGKALDGFGNATEYEEAGEIDNVEFRLETSTTVSSSPTNGMIRLSVQYGNISPSDTVGIMFPLTNALGSSRYKDEIVAINNHRSNAATVELFGHGLYCKLLLGSVQYGSEPQGFFTFGGRVVEILGTLDTDTAIEYRFRFAGSDGYTGPQGAQGLQGTTGPQGLQGNTGSQGATGPQGQQGNQGPAGDQGPQGQQGNQGPAGDQGPQGQQGNQGPAGDQGPQGQQGNQGPAGDQGPQGNQGNQGPAGDQGPQGNQGNQGSAGDQGPQGNQGNQGPAGDQGPQGNQGNQGPAGDQGPQGNQGNQGPAGDQGPQGATGPQGQTGSGLASISGATDNYMLTAGSTSNVVNAESNLTWNSQKLTVTGSSANDTVLDIQGTSNQLFSVVDSTTGDLFTVKDSVGVDIFNITSSALGEFLATLRNSRISYTDISADTTLFDITQSYANSMWVDYFASNGTSSRAGSLAVVWDGTNVEYTEYATTDIGTNTDGLSFQLTDEGTVTRLSAKVTSGTWQVKCGVRVM